MNQDNFICDGRYMELDGSVVEFPLQGVKLTKEPSVFGIFDGMGGEERGEVASYIAAKDAAALEAGKNTALELSQFCEKANADICRYAAENQISSMGTTAAVIVFTKQEITICNIGDSKILRFCGGELEQISQDHVTAAAFGIKPPLSQNLGIPPEELSIAPYLAQGSYNHNDVYLICSDGLTDMVALEDIKRTLNSKPLEEAGKELLEKALGNGGRDNITIILCKVKRESRGLFGRKCCVQKKEV